MADHSPTEEHDLAMLDRKRARDRKSQRAMRERTKEELMQLKHQLQQADNTMASYHARFSHEIAHLVGENSKLRQEVQNLKERESCCHDQRRLNISSWATRGVSLEASIGAAWCPNLFSKSVSSLDRSQSLENAYIPPADHEHYPVSSPPIIPSDRIMTSFIDHMRMKHGGRPSSASSSHRPPDTATEVICAAISKVAVDVLSTYSEITTVRKKAAGLFLIVNVLNVFEPFLHASYELIRL